MTALDVYLRPSICFCYDAVYPWQLNGTWHLYETGHNSRLYGIAVSDMEIVMTLIYTVSQHEVINY